MRGWSSNVLAAGTLTLLISAGHQGPARVACRGVAVGAYGALLQSACLLPEQERQQHQAPPRGHLQDLVQVRAAEQQRSTGSRPVQLGPVLGEAQLTALIAVVKVEGEREPTVRGRGAEVVAVGTEEPTVGRLVAGDLEALEAARPVGERLRQLGQDPTTDRGGQLAAALRVLHDVVAAALQLGVELLGAPTARRGLHASLAVALLL